MSGWKMTMIEPTLDDLLEDEVMHPVMRSAGIDAAGLKASLAETARRLPSEPRKSPARHKYCAAAMCP
jgi:hypothetical protein